MRNSLISPLLLCMSLLSTAALAESIAVPDREHRKGMSYEEYSAFREKMRTQIRNKNNENSGGNRESLNSTTDQAGDSKRDRVYGKGFHSRSQQDRPDNDARNKPDRPRVEKFNRGNMGGRR